MTHEQSDRRGPRKSAKRFSKNEVKQFEQAGGAEGGMPAGHAGGPGETDEVETRATERDEGR